MDMRKKRRPFAKFNQKIDVTLQRFLFTCTRTEHTKLFRFVCPCDSVYLIALRMYLIKHAHNFILKTPLLYSFLSTVAMCHGE